MTDIILPALPTLPTLEYRVYYDDTGTIITYTTDKLEGKYLIIDRETYSHANHQLFIINNRLVDNRRKRALAKLSKTDKSDTGFKCSKYDINIIIDNDNTEVNHWEETIYEY